MQPSGFEESPSAYVSDDPRRLLGQIRRLGSAGPAYEIVSIDEESNVHIEVIHSGEKVIFPLHEVLDDPMAETIP